MTIRVVVAALAAAVLLASCSAPPAPLTTEPTGEVAVDGWVVVTYDDTVETFDVNVMDSLLETELAADEALQAAGAGYIEGNDIGQRQYNLYFIGKDATQMWSILEPIFEAAPVHWSSVELRSGLDDPDPVVLGP